MAVGALVAVGLYRACRVEQLQTLFSGPPFLSSTSDSGSRAEARGEAKNDLA